MWMLIACLVAPLVVVPLLAYGSRHLFAIFIREGAELFVGMEVHRDWSITLGTDVAIVNALIFAVAWWATVGLSTLQISALTVILPLLLGVVIALWFTGAMVKGRLKLQGRDAWLVGLLSFAGGNLPLICVIPFLVMLIIAPHDAVLTTND